MESAEREELAVGRKLQGGHHGLPRIGGGMVFVIAVASGFGRVVGRALGDPLADDFEFRGGQRRLILGHLGLTLFGRDEVEQVAVVRLFGDDRHGLRVASLEEAVKAGHDETAASLGGLVTPLALGLKDRADLLVVADRVVRGGLGGLGRDGR